MGRARDPAWDTAAVYLRELERAHPVSRQEEVELFGEARQGDEKAREALAWANLRFVVTVARKYEGRGLPLDELIAEGNAGLMEAIDRFDETRGLKFITFAVWWIRQAILKALPQSGRSVRVPVSVTGDARHVYRQAESVSQELGRDPTRSELMERVDLSDERVERALTRGRGEVSLEAPRGDSGEMWRDSFPAVAATAEEAATVADLGRALRGVLDALNSRERLVVEKYYGLESRAPLNLQEIGDRLGVTRERVRQLRNNALLNLRREWERRRLTSHCPFTS